MAALRISGQALLCLWPLEPGAGARVLGRVYLYPSVLPEVTVELFFWKVAEAPLTDAELEAELRAWLGKVWQWPAPRLPGVTSPGPSGQG